MSSPARTYKTSAVVLRARPFGEADKIVILFSTQRGKMDAIAKGARRTKSHLSGRLEIANEVLLGMHRGRNLDVIVSADLESSNWQELVRPDRFAAAGLVMELIDGFCEPDLPLPEVYALLTAALRAIGRSEEPLDLIPRFSLRLLDSLGLAPPLEACIHCGKPIVGGDAYLDAEQGGFACAPCRVAWRDMLLLTENDMANLRALAAAKGGTGKAGSRSYETRGASG